MAGDATEEAADGSSAGWWSPSWPPSLPTPGHTCLRDQPLTQLHARGGNSRKISWARHRAEATADHSLDLYATPPAHTVLHLPSPDATHQHMGAWLSHDGRDRSPGFVLKGPTYPISPPSTSTPRAQMLCWIKRSCSAFQKKSCWVLYFCWGLRGEAKTHHRKCRLFLKSIGL